MQTSHKSYLIIKDKSPDKTESKFHVALHDISTVDIDDLYTFSLHEVEGSHYVFHLLGVYSRLLCVVSEGESLVMLQVTVVKY